jgi:hypothetical protein
MNTISDFHHPCKHEALRQGFAPRIRFWGRRHHGRFTFWNISIFDNVIAKLLNQVIGLEAPYQLISTGVSSVPPELALSRTSVLGLNRNC